MRELKSQKHGQPVVVPAPLSGSSLPKTDFHFKRYGSIDSHALAQVVAGLAPGFVVEQFLAPRDCDAIVRNFLNSPLVRERQDGVRGRTIGVDQYGVDGPTYFRQAEAARPHILALFEGADDVPARLARELGRALPAGSKLSPLSHAGVNACPLRAVQWTDQGALALKCHDDRAQLTDPRSAMLGLGGIANPLAINLYPSVTSEGGELIVYNIRPDDLARARLNVSHSGYPYEPEVLIGFSSIHVRPQPGDLVILAGAFVHGVVGARGTGIRLLLNQFIGEASPGSFVQWT